MSVILTGDDVGPIVAALRQSRLCEGLSPEELRLVAGRVRPVLCPAGEMICRVGEPGDSMFIVAKGRLKVAVPERGGEERLLAYLSRGDHFGEIALLDEGKRAANVTAVFDSELLVLDQHSFHQLFEELPQVGKNLIHTLGFRLKETLLRKRHRFVARIVGLVHSSPRGKALAEILVGRLADRGERVLVLGDRAVQQTTRSWPIEPLAGGQGDDWKSTLGGRLHRLIGQNDRVVLDLPLADLAGVLCDVLRRCDEVLWLVEPDGERDSRRAFREASGVPEIAARTHVVWLLPEGQQVAPECDAGWNSGNGHFKLELCNRPEQPSRRQNQGVDRLVRHLRGIRTGLALGGGGARGLAHLGVLRALDQAGISFDMMAGTSSGAMMGIGYASGYEPDFAMERFGRTLTPSRLFRMIPGGSRWYLQIMFRTGAWDRMLRPYFHDWRLEQFQIPFHAVTVDLVTGRQVVRETGDAIHALLESINIPVISAPIRRNGMALVDGGVLNNLPADVLAQKGADFVVGVNVTARLPHEFAGNRPGMAAAKMKRAGWMETILRVFETQGYELNTIRAKAVDLLIEPDTARFPFADFTRAQELAAAGQAAAEAVIPHLKTLLAELDGGSTRR